MSEAAAATATPNPKTPPPPKATVAAVPTPIHPLLPNKVQPAGHTILRLEALIPAGTPKENLISPDFWVHAMGKLQMYCQIECLWEDGSQFMRVMCTHNHGRASRFVCMEYHEMEALTGGLPDFGDDFKVEARGVKKWCVIDNRTGAVLKEMIATQVLALQELEELRRARAR